MSKQVMVELLYMFACIFVKRLYWYCLFEGNLAITNKVEINYTLELKGIHLTNFFTPVHIHLHKKMQCIIIAKYGENAYYLSAC